MEWLIITILGLTCWWLWADRDYWKETAQENNYKKHEKPSKVKEEKKKAEESLAIEYDEKIPHPFK